MALLSKSFGIKFTFSYFGDYAHFTPALWMSARSCWPERGTREGLQRRARCTVTSRHPDFICRVRCSTALTGARTATAVRTPFARFSAVYAPFSQPPDLTLDRLRREGFLHVFTSWKRIATRAGGLYRRGYPIPPPSNTRQPFRITLSRPSASSIAFPRA